MCQASSRSGDREPFDRAKVIAGLEAATKARPVEHAQLDDLALAVEESARLEGSEISTEAVGRAVLDRLRDLDVVAAGTGRVDLAEAPGPRGPRWSCRSGSRCG